MDPSSCWRTQHSDFQVSVTPPWCQSSLSDGRDTSPHPDAANSASNNNVAAAVHGDRLYLAWRTAPLHFAGHNTRIHVVSSADSGASWDMETSIFLGTDLREPMFLSISGKLFFSFFQGGTNPVDFEPLGLYRMEMVGLGEWTEPQLYGHQGEVVWEGSLLTTDKVNTLKILSPDRDGERDRVQPELQRPVRTAG